MSSSPGETPLNPRTKVKVGERRRRRIAIPSGSSLNPRMIKEVTKRRRLAQIRRSQYIASFMIVLIGEVSV